MSETLAAPDVKFPPTQAELPYDDGIPMESQRHKVQMELLIDVVETWLEQREDGYTSGNMFVYFSLAQLKNQDFRGPDFFAVLGVPKGERRSWVVWEEGKGPDVVIELLSPATAATDKSEKKLIYQNQMRVPEYFWFDPFNPDDWAGFSLGSGVYQPITPNAENQLVSQALGLVLLRWQGTYKGVNTTWLRWATLDGELLPTAEEKAHQWAEQERQRAERAELQLQQTARNLLQSGMTAAQVANITGLSESEIEKLNI
ncbi:MAG: Uma2 family endonuclease [Aulosira sp. ZfuVER01]|nr:Uma2 family endonuclease [Aulosira sp. ZfuVER01]MDZ8002058.1 Uma2 family endonuclease [Aulosira sp. DedVER01a]MDZ8056278.1 Uma2 family endonuclease [Aulosira sp. ZfuCHP01]